MSQKGYRYTYKLQSGHVDEVAEVCFVYKGIGWKEVGLLPPDRGMPTHIIFEWTKDTPALYPPVNWP